VLGSFLNVHLCTFVSVSTVSVDTKGAATSKLVLFVWGFKKKRNKERKKFHQAEA